MALTKITSNAFAASAVDSDAVGANTITTAKIADNNVTHAKLHTDMDLSSKTVTLPTLSQAVTITAPSDAEGLKLLGRSSDDIGQLKFYENDGTTSLARLDARTTKFDVASYSDLHLSAGGVATDSIVIKSSGNVGIGTDSPDTKFQIGNGIEASNRLRFFVPNLVSLGAGIQFYVASTEYFNIDYNSDTNKLLFNTDTTFGSNIHLMTLDRQTRRVGIGTDSPRDVLEVSRTSTDQTAGLTLTNLQAGGYGSGIVWKSVRSDGGSVLTAAEIVVAGENAWNSDGNTASQMQFWTQKDNTLTKHMTLTKNGYLGIGTASPTQTLHVEGDIRLGSSSARKIVFGSAGGANDYIELQDIGSTGNIFNLVQDGNSKLKVQGVSGWVGIGADNPTQKLTIGSDDSTSDVGYIRLRGYNQLESNIYKTANYGIHMDTDSNSQGIRIDGGKLVLGITGNVGIGTELPGAKLHVIGDFLIGQQRFREGYVGISGSETRWYKLINYATGAMLIGRAYLTANRFGGYNQTGAYREYKASISGFSNSIYGPLNTTGDTGESGVMSLELGTDEHLYLRVNSSIYGGTVYFYLQGYINNWQFDSSTYLTSAP